MCNGYSTFYFSINSNFFFTLKFVIFFVHDFKKFVMQNEPNIAQHNLICYRTIYVLGIHYIHSMTETARAHIHHISATLLWGSTKEFCLSNQ
jgi:hypothetical protein